MNSDLYAYEKSKMGNIQMVNPVDKKNVVEINDSNTGNYNSNILKYDLSSLYNQSLFVDWDAPNSYLAIPIITHLQLTATTQGNSHKFLTTGNNYALGYKNGFYQLIDNVSLKCGNNQLSSGNNNANVLTNFKNLTTYSRDNLENADIFGFAPDGHESWSYAKLDDTEGVKTNSLFKNNKIRQNLFGVKTTDSGTASASYGNIEDSNSGFLTRIKRLNGNFNAGNSRNNIGANILLPLGVSSDNSMDTVTVTDYDIVYKNMMFIKMKDISDFFSKVGYSRFYCTLEIQLNIGKCEIQLPLKVGLLEDKDIISVSSSFQKGTCPFMISKFGEGLNCVTGVSGGVGSEATKLTIQNAIVTSPMTIIGGSVPKTGITTSSLYCQTVQLKTEMESSLLVNKVKQIVYEDFYQADVNILAKANVNYIATNGIANLKAILLVPFIAASHNLGYSPLLSPFTSEPGNTSALINLTNAQILLSGERILPSEIRYNFKNWLDNNYGCRSINGGRTDELNSGLINYHMFMNNYRYMYFDVSHIDNTTPKAITIQAKNENDVDIQLMVFAIYDKKCNLDIASGALNLE